MKTRGLSIIGIAGGVVLVGLALWLILSGHPLFRLLGRLYADQEFLRERLQAWGPWAPLVFIIVQALQVVIAPVPGEVTGFLGGFVFGQWLGFVYSMLGLTAGSVLAFGVGRWLGAAFVHRVVHREVWERLGFIVEAEGAVLCFVLYLIPGFPKDILCYLFGLSPMPFWVFAVTATLGRIPGTWVLAAQGARTATGDYVRLALLTALVAALAIPLYYYRHRVLSWSRRRDERGDPPGSSRS
ncbi:MAG: TVP38/TMEM64 family protein [Candidatus Rokubacteria bacterium]|nr:TVP38/TMEM64 family protein [Candidatus Rokubacteria bacterium]